MPWNGTTKMMTGAVGHGDISAAVNVAGPPYPMGNMVDSGLLNPMAVFKPIQYASLTSPSDAVRAGLNHGIYVPEEGSLAAVFQSGAAHAWRYLKPDGGMNKYRNLDFVSASSPSTKGYYSDAPRNILCCLQEGILEFNLVNEAVSHDPIVFYAFSKNGDANTNAFFDKQPSTTQGISNTSYGHSSAQLDCCIGIEDLTTDNSNALYGSGHRLGLALNGATEGYSFIECQADLVNNDPNRTLTRIQIPVDTIKALTADTYDAVGCLRIHDQDLDEDHYVPLPALNWSGADGLKNSFTLKLSGTESYLVTVAGVAESINDTPAFTVHDSVGHGMIYLFLNFKNVSNITHMTTPVTAGQFEADVHLEGSWTSGQTTHNLNFHLNPGLHSVIGGTHSGNAWYVAPGETVQLVFYLRGVWDNDGQEINITSGSVDITECQLKFGDLEFLMGPSRTPRIEYP